MNKLEEIRSDETFLSLLTQALSSLYSSGVLEILRELGRVQPVSVENPNYVTALASQAEYSRGYNQALDDLIGFREKFLDPVATKATAPDYGAIQTALDSGDLTKEEADDLRSKS